MMTIALSTWALKTPGIYTNLFMYNVVLVMMSLDTLFHCSCKYSYNKN